jgi:hypothetical protein
MEAVSWLCIAGVVPFAAMGFVRYHGMNCEQLVWAWLRLVIEPKEYKVRTRNVYEEATRESRKLRQKESEKEAHRSYKQDKRGTRAEKKEEKRNSFPRMRQ